MKRRNFAVSTVIAALAAAFLGVSPPAGAEGEDVAVIVHKANPVAPMNRAQLGALFKARSTQFPGGKRADAVNLGTDDPIRQEFDYAVLGMRPDEVERFWLDNKIRSGVGSPPRLSGPDAVVRFVAGDEAGIGYVASADATDAVRVVARIRGGVVVAP